MLPVEAHFQYCELYAGQTGREFYDRSNVNITLYIQLMRKTSTYDHRTLKTRLPVRSALFKQRTGGLVVRWVTTSEYPLLYVFAFCHVFAPVVVEIVSGCVVT
jgi:hypothetical protein